MFAVLPHLPHLSSLALKTSDVAFAPHVAPLTQLTALELECDTNGEISIEAQAKAAWMLAAVVYRISAQGRTARAHGTPAQSGQDFLVPTSNGTCGVAT